MRKNTIRSAFTMLELVFVIVILGIVSSIGSTIIADVYGNYIVQRSLYNATLKTDLAVKQIAARLALRMNNTIIGRRPSDNDIINIISLTPADSDHVILEWIGYDNDSFSATATPGWSGFCDINDSTQSLLDTPGSNLANTSTIITNLGGDPTSDLAILFNGAFYNNASNTMYNVGGLGYNSIPYTTISPVTITAPRTLTMADVNPKTVYDQYKLVWSAYAIVPVQQSQNLNTDIDESKLFDLELRYNYQPWNGIQYDNANTLRKTLVKDVTVFKFRGVGETLRIKLCVQEKISASETVNICKEKAVIR